jgi:hypothetical protein
VTIGNGATYIDNSAFGYCSNLASVTIGDSVNSIGSGAFSCCSSLTAVQFEGNCPADVRSDAFYNADNAIVYYLPGTTGWGPTFGGRPTALWRPQIQTGDASFGLRTNQFGFNIGWASGRVVVVEACTNVANPIWSPVGTNTLTDGSGYFSDPSWTNYAARVYRIRGQ